MVAINVSPMYIKPEIKLLLVLPNSEKNRIKEYPIVADTGIAYKSIDVSSCDHSFNELFDIVVIIAPTAINTPPVNKYKGVLSASFPVSDFMEMHNIIHKTYGAIEINNNLLHGGLKVGHCRDLNRRIEKTGIVEKIYTTIPRNKISLDTSFAVKVFHIGT